MSYRPLTTSIFFNAELLKTAERMVTTLVQSNNNQGSSRVEKIHELRSSIRFHIDTNINGSNDARISTLQTKLNAMEDQLFSP